jgi:hypothetical protein
LAELLRLVEVRVVLVLGMLNGSLEQAADQKVIQTVGRWTFEPASAAAVVAPVEIDVGVKVVAE